MKSDYENLPAGTRLQTTRIVDCGCRLEKGEIVVLAISSKDMNNWLKSKRLIPHTNDGLIWVTKPEHYESSRHIDPQEMYFLNNSKTNVYSTFVFYTIPLISNKDLKYLLENI